MGRFGDFWRSTGASGLPTARPRRAVSPLAAVVADPMIDPAFAEAYDHARRVAEWKRLAELERFYDPETQTAADRLVVDQFLARCPCCRLRASELHHPGSRSAHYGPCNNVTLWAS